MRLFPCLRRLSWPALLWLATIAVSAAGQRGTGDPPGERAPRVLSDSLAGRDSFDLYCAPCHGSDARGDGPVAPVLKTPPPDLTLMARRNRGVFPAERIRAYVTGTGRRVPAHGPPEMPIWGPLFQAFETDVRVQERIRNLVQYLSSLQRPSS